MIKSRLFLTKLDVTFCQFRYLCQASPAAKNSTTNEDKKRAKRVKLFCTPSLSDDDIVSIQSVVALNITTNFVGWAKIERHENTISNVGFQPLPNTFNKMNLNELFSIASVTFRSLPQANHYILESFPKTIGGNGGRIQLSLHSARLQFTSMLVAMCNSDINTTNKRKLLATILLKQNLHGRLYGLLLGNEIVSTLRTVNSILEGNLSKRFTPVNCSHQTLSCYKNSRELEKEFIGRALLIGLTFMELVVYQNRGCVEMLNFSDRICQGIQSDSYPNV